ncbi:MAG TPA: type II toxin-antitoxin system VapC family toxin [Terriglobia bacterium]|nr:type II toxin-antitoxin system VapC family toxin [Terriglobia bacterium]
MTRFVIDASVAAKWFLPSSGEPLAREALRLLDAYAEGRVQFAVPDLFWAECANICWKAVGRGRWTGTAAQEAISALERRRLPTTPSLELLEDALSIAATFNRTVYDSLYVALALHLKAELVTADDRLAQALAAHLPVKWLGSV